MTHLKRKLLLTLIALLALTTHAWADDPKVYNSGEVNLDQLEVGDILMPGVQVKTSSQYSLSLLSNRWSIYGVILQDGARISSLPFTIGVNGLITAVLAGDQSSSDCMPITKDGETGNAWVVIYKVFTANNNETDIRIGGTTYPAPTPVPLTQGTGEKINEWTLTNKMPAGNVTVNVNYFPKAGLAANGAPTAITGVAATTDDPIVTPGTVANITGSQTPQGTLMYYASQTEKTDAQLLALTADKWSADVPTAANLAKGNAYVYYYIQGAEPAQGTDRTDANTRSDGDILAANVVNVTLGDAPLWNAEFAFDDNVTDAEKAKWSTDIADGGVVKGTNVTVTYTGTKKILGVKAEKKSTSTPLDDATTAWTAGTYAVPAGGLTYSDAITVSGDVTLVLTDGETLTLNKGISLASGATLTVQGNGTMNVNGTKNSTASTVAGTGTLVLTSGTLNAKGGNGAGLGNLTSGADMREYAGGNAINGNVTVSGGTLTATGGNGGVVGETSSYSYGAAGGTAISGSVTVTGGAVTATGGNGGSIGSNTHDAYGGNGGAAIGGNATLTSGTWTATDGTPGVNNGGQGGAGGKAVAGTVTDNR